MSEKITLVCTSLNPNVELLNKMLDSASQFDEIILNIDQRDNHDGIECKTRQISRLFNTFHWPIPIAYNHLIDEVNTEWVCCFCDDDYFYFYGLSKMIAEIHKGIDADIAHFKFHVSGYVPPQDVRCWFGKKEYDLCEHGKITPKYFEKHNRLPAGSFFRKTAWEKVGGFKGDKCHDWDLWKRMADAGMKFKYFDYLVYNFVRRDNSAWMRQHTRG